MLAILTRRNVAVTYSNGITVKAEVESGRNFPTKVSYCQDNPISGGWRAPDENVFDKKEVLECTKTTIEKGRGAALRHR